MICLWSGRIWRLSSPGLLSVWITFSGSCVGLCGLGRGTGEVYLWVGDINLVTDKYDIVVSRIIICTSLWFSIDVLYLMVFTVIV